MALAFVACQTEPNDVVSNADLVDVVLNVAAPELDATRADNDGINERNSALGGIDFMTDADWANYDLRYILEIYDENDNDGANGPIYRERLVKCVDKYVPTTFDLRLVPGRKYKFVVFADYVAEDNAELTEPADLLNIRDLYYDTADLRNITCITENPTWNAMNEVRDAYFISKKVEINVSTSETLTLTRPFAKLRVVTTDLDYIKGYTAPGYVEIKYQTLPIYKSFNAVNGELNATEMAGEELTHKYEVAKHIPYTAGYDAKENSMTLFADYLLAKEGEQIPVNFEMTVYESKGGRPIHTQDFNTQIPIQRNHLTTIVGDLLTTQANITIEINDELKDGPVIGAGESDTKPVSAWGSGEIKDGNYEFVVTGENDFVVIVKDTAVENNQLKAGTYEFVENKADLENGKFTVEDLQATRSLTNVNVVGGEMIVKAEETNYNITLDLVLQYEDTQEYRHAVYEYEGEVQFGESLDIPYVTATVDGNTVTVEWEAVEDATKYFVAMNEEAAVETTELVKVYENLEWNTLYTFSVKAANDTLESVVATVEATTGEKPAVPTYKLYLNNEDGWAKVNVYAWDESATLLGDWPGTEMTEKETIEGVEYFVYALGEEFTGKTINVIFNNGEGKQTADITGVEIIKDNFFTNYVEPVAPSDTVLYLKPNANWITDGARFAAYFWNDNGNAWESMTLVEGETDIYAVTVPAGFENIIFCRMNPGTTDNNWSNKYNQTADLKVPTDGTNLYTVKESTWDNGGGAWSTYTPAVVEPVVLATPVVSATVEGNVVTLSWTAVENAAQYGITVGTEMPVFVEETTYVFTGEYETEYTFNVVAVPADEENFAVSEAAVVTATTDAEPQPDTMTIAEALAVGQNNTIGGTIEGIVISNYELNNLTSKKGMYVQDETGALQFYLEANHEFAFGTKVRIDLTEATLGAYNGAVQVSKVALDKIEVISTGNTVEPKTVSMADFLANKYEGQYIALEGVQVAKTDLSKTWVSGGAHTSINMEDANGNKFVVFSSKYATYGTSTVAQGSGVIKGIASINNGNIQIIFAQASDFADLTGERFGDNGGEEPTPDPEQPGGGEEPAPDQPTDGKTVRFNVADYGFTNGTALTTYTVNPITFAFDGGGNSNSPKYYTSGSAVRCYPKNTITVSGKTITKIVVNAPSGYNNAIDLYCGSTKLDNFTWTGNSSEPVVLTFDVNKSSGQSRFVTIDVTYAE